MADKPSIPKGTRDFNPLEMARRNFIFDTIRKIFKTYGYLPIETPAMENLSSLMGKYGEEGDKLLFKILNSGDFKAKLDAETLHETPAGRLGVLIAEKGLRYDLTVPFARFVVQHRNDIAFPFKRYQIQPVWRADRPQRGRYREFYQCDVDVIGSHSLLNEFELMQIMDEVFTALGLKVVIKLNNRKVLAGIVEVIGEPDRMIDITVAIDKLDKIGMEKVLAELDQKGLSKQSVEKLKPVLEMEGTTSTKLNFLSGYLNQSEIGMEGLMEVDKLFGFLKDHPVDAAVEFDLTLARGLNYYTGTIFEVKSDEVQIGSICGGGRYDNLTGIFGLEGVSGVGVSFGADRIYDVLLQLERFPQEREMDTQLLFVNFGENEANYILSILRRLRSGGIASELYPDPVKMKKQMTYANNRKIPFVALVGEQEMQDGVITLKEMETGNQERLTPAELVERLSNNIS
ncbi:MAG: histidine--tRNA ligase [Bacteroidetes bacterium]|nr:MAG: histidine--tRNA ligase [Bacteroidota bacterium]